MSEIFIVKNLKSYNSFKKIILNNGHELKLRPYVYIKEGDNLEFIPTLEDFKEIFKVFEDKTTKKIKKVRIHPPYNCKEIVCVPPHKFEVIFRERIDSKDWEKVKELEKFHYRGKGLNKIVGRRTVLLAEIKEFGIVGFGVISAAVAVAQPRFKLFNTNFTEQMKTGLINKIVRIPRVVIHPEFRGMHLGILLVKHLINYIKDYWDINHYTPIMIEVIAAMTEYHKFFEKAGFVNIGYTSGYEGKAIIPKYGTGAFKKRNPSNYDFMVNQKPKPYLVYPLIQEVEQKIKSFKKLSPRSILVKTPKLKKTIKFKRVSVKYKISNGSTQRTTVIKDIFGVDSEHAFSPVIQDFCLVIEPGDVVLITGASGSGKTTILKLLTLDRITLKKLLSISGALPRIKRSEIAVLNNNFDYSKPLIDQIKIGKNIKEAINLLNSVGLTEAHLYIKTPDQLSEGQKYRFALAKICDSEKPIWIVDEFASTLNPEMAAIVAKGIRKLAYRYGVTVVLSAPHVNYFIESLLPNKVVKLKWGMKPEVYSLKITNISERRDKILFSLLNNGDLPLNNLEIGYIKINGIFKCEKMVECIKPTQSLDITLNKLDDKEVDAIVIKTKENVGEILYFQ